jgi:hypothetical protein
MGISLEEAARIAHLMPDPNDQVRYGRPKSDDAFPPPRADKSERKEQGHFANWLLLKNSEGRKIPWVWHATHAPSKATPGCPDFLVGINRVWLSLEFKRDYAAQLSPEQKEFCEACEEQKLIYRVVYSAAEAIDIIEKLDSL